MSLSEKCKSTSPSVIKVKSQQKTISIEEKLDIIFWLKKVEQIVDMCHNMRFAHIHVHAIHDIADRITGSAKSGTKVCLCSKTTAVFM